jgi:hypothetical protein
LESWETNLHPTIMLPIKGGLRCKEREYIWSSLYYSWDKTQRLPCLTDLYIGTNPHMAHFFSQVLVDFMLIHYLESTHINSCHNHDLCTVHCTVQYDAGTCFHNILLFGKAICAIFVCDIFMTSLSWIPSLQYSNILIVLQPPRLEFQRITKQQLRFTWGWARGSYCSNIEFGGLTRALLYMSLLCVRIERRGLRFAWDDRTSG